MFSFSRVGRLITASDLCQKTLYTSVYTFSDEISCCLLGTSTNTRYNFSGSRLNFYAGTNLSAMRSCKTVTKINIALRDLIVQMLTTQHDGILRDVRGSDCNDVAEQLVVLLAG